MKLLDLYREARRERQRESANEQAVHWQALRELLMRADDPAEGDESLLLEIVETLGVTESELELFGVVVTEHARIDRLASELQRRRKALAAAEKHAGQCHVEYEAAFRAWGLANSAVDSASTAVAECEKACVERASLVNVYPELLIGEAGNGAARRLTNVPAVDSVMRKLKLLTPTPADE